MLWQVPDAALVGGAFLLDSRAKAEQTVIPAIVNSIMTAGFAEPGDMGGAQFVRDAGPLADGASFQSDDGAWWKLAVPNINARMFGAVGDGVTDDTIPFQDAIDYLENLGGGIIYGVDGLYSVTQLVTPVNPACINFYGSGRTSCLFTPREADTPFLVSDKTAPFTRSEGMVWKDFGVVCNEDGDHADPTHILIDTQGMAHCLFQDVAFFNNANGTGSAYALFYTSSDTQLTYLQRFSRMYFNSVSGPQFGLKTGSIDAPRNTNLIYCDDWWVNLVTNMTAAQDFSHATMFASTDSLIEGGGGGDIEYGIIPGNTGYIQGNWFELLNSDPVKFQNSMGSVVSAGVNVRSNYFSGYGGDIDIPDGCGNNQFNNNGGGNFTISPANAADNFISIQGPVCAEPVLTKVSGAAGVLTKVSADVFSKLTNTWKLVYTWAPTAANSVYGFAVTSQAGYVPRSMVTGVLDSPNGVPMVSEIGSALNAFLYTQNGTTNTVTITVLLSYN